MTSPLYEPVLMVTLDGEVGLSGSPNIADAIFEKARECAVFVADVSIIGAIPSRRHTPNPNVLIELGYAVAHKSWPRIVCVCNTASAAVEQLPFDLRGRRIVTYELGEAASTETQAEAKRMLDGKIASAIREAFVIST